MKKRYDWDREYKGSHPRGNLSTPDYQAARAKERLEERKQILRESVQDYQDRVDELTSQLDATVDRQWNRATNAEMIDRYLRVCSDEAYAALVNTGGWSPAASSGHGRKVKPDHLLRSSTAGSWKG